MLTDTSESVTMWDVRKRDTI